ncbi:pilus assembly PilX family protein [Methyloprofundus sp.]|uniref:pilus assembly PilX family protein n=1 Tax=Methyloprofundus sp. TaxID=2020875 RepID=UPI003D103C3B
MKTNNKGTTSLHSRNNGAATLLVAVILGFLAIFIGIFASQVGIMEQKTSANDARYKEAFAAAEAGLEDAIRYVKKNASIITAAAAEDPPVAYYLKTPKSVLTGGASYFFEITRVEKANALVEVISTGTSADGSGEAIVRQMLGYYKLNNAGDGPDVPLIVDGPIDVSGSMEIVVNPNGGGAGIPLSMWTSETITLGNNSAGTCHMHEYLDSDDMLDPVNNPYQVCDPNKCFCLDNERISNTVDDDNPNGNSTPGYDTISTSSGYSDGSGIAPNSDIDEIGFPDDMFAYVTGTPGPEWETKKGEIAANGGLYNNCNDLNTNTTGNIWIEGDCDLKNDIASVVAPVLLIVHGNLTITGGKIFGVVFIFAKENVIDLEVTGNGNGAVYGALISDKPLKILTNGSFDIVYQKRIFDAIYGTGGIDETSDAFKDIARVAGTWRDF